MKLIKGAKVITLNQAGEVIDQGAVLVDGDLIKEVGDYQELKSEYKKEIAEIIDLSDKIIMPGMINTHLHFYSAFARGISLNTSPAKDLSDILENLWWCLDKKLDHKMIYYSALVTIIEAIKNGTTTVFDHHASPNAIKGSLTEIAKAVNETGIRANLSYEVSNRDGAEKAEAGIQENLRFINYCRQENNNRLSAAIGLHALFTLNDETLAKVARNLIDAETGIHIHLGEGAIDQRTAQKKYDLSLMERLEKFSLCNEKLVAAHGVHLAEEDYDLLAEYNANLIHNPQSNMNNAVGYAKAIKMLEEGILVGLGTDGMTTDQFSALKVANLLHKHNLSNPNAGGAEVYQMAFENNQAIANKFFPTELGSLAKGKAADLIALDYKPTTPLTAENYYAHILGGMSGAMVDLTMVAGEVLMKDREIIGLDTKEIYQQARLQAERLWNRF